MGDSISTVEAIQSCGGIAPVHVGDSISTVGDSISTAEAIQYCGVKFLIFLYLVDIANQKLSVIYNFERWIFIATDNSDECEADQCVLTTFPVPVFWNCQNGGVRSKMRMFGYLGYRGYFFSDFYKSEFFIFTYSEIRKLGLQKIRNFQTSFRYSPTVKYKNLSSKIRDFNTNIHLDLVDICLQSNTKAWITKNLRFSNIRVFDIRLQIFKHPSFRYLSIVKYENLDHKNPRFLNVQQNIQLF